MPQYMLDMIVANRNTETTRSVIEASLTQTSAQMSFCQQHDYF
jgi:hypothetical protein